MPIVASSFKSLPIAMQILSHKLHCNKINPSSSLLIVFQNYILSSPLIRVWDYPILEFVAYKLVLARHIIYTYMTQAPLATPYLYIYNSCHIVII